MSLSSKDDVYVYLPHVKSTHPVKGATQEGHRLLTGKRAGMDGWADEQIDSWLLGKYGMFVESSPSRIMSKHDDISN